MANTEGMPDEFVESLAMATAGDLSAMDRNRTGMVPSSSSSPSSNSALERRRLRLQSRLELPMGEAPAAKVTRPSSTRQQKGGQVRFKEDEGGIGDRHGGQSSALRDASSRDENEPTGAHAALTPLVGNVVEHDRAPRRASKRSINGGQTEGLPVKTSRFAQQNRSLQTGFPSVNVPLGTFVERGRFGTTAGKRVANVDNAYALSSGSDSKGLTSNRPAATPKASAINRTIHLSANDLKGASEKDAQAMLANLSLDEIKHYKDEVESALSPDMVSFLKNRGRSSARAKISLSVALEAEQNTQLTPRRTETSKPFDASSQEASSNHKSTLEKNVLERSEKERISRLVASVKSHEDLDAAFHAEMQQSHPLELDKEEKTILINEQAAKNFHMACDLLRSTSPRQALWAARTVSLRLEEIANERVRSTLSSIAEAKATLPAVLSVSLRCLLDKPLTTTCLLHTYALQSLYYLTIIFAHSGHVVSMIPSAKMTVDACIFQEYFMEDAVPMSPLNAAYPPMSVKPLSVEENGNEARITTSETTTTRPVAYAASSSTTSAVGDGQAFEMDPMWTLLSRMKILPRVSFLVQNFVRMPVEAWVAICGLLSMVGQRSPGAASAIVKHETLMSQLIRRTQQHLQEGTNVDTEKTDGDMITYATMRLLCILARQSRVAAQGLPLEDILPPLLATEASSNVEFRSQQLALILWRTALRYGLALEALASMLTLSARHLSLPYSNQYSLSTEFVSAFTQVLECVKVVQSKRHEDITSLRRHDETMINQRTMIIIDTATKYMTSTTRLILPKSSVTASNLEDEAWILKYRWNAARFHYLSTWYQLLEHSVEHSRNVAGNVAMGEMASADIGNVVSALCTWAEADGDMERAWRLSSQLQALHVDTNDSIYENVNLELEAAACAFLQGFVSIALTIARWNSPIITPFVNELRCSLLDKATARILGGFRVTLESPVSNTVIVDSISLPREGWVNQSHFAVAKLLLHTLFTNGVASSSDLALVRMMVFSLVGRLRRGDESMAAVLFSSDVLFQTSGNPLHEDNLKIGSSPVSSMFLGELCGSERARNQLDHSFKLQHGFGLTSSGFGPFALDSLLSEADQPATAASIQADDEVLPLGRLWLWKSLSGSIHVREQVVTAGTVEAIEVIVAILDLILELDEAEDVCDIAGYSRRVPLGSKLYYLMNVCLQPETVFSDDRILDSGEAILDRYLEHFGESEQDILDFFVECSHHSTPAKGRIKQGDIDDDVDKLDKMEDKDMKLLEQFVNRNEAVATRNDIPVQQVRALENLIEDLSNAYRDYGAQYDFYTNCIRVFLLPVFPVSIRCRALKELEGMLHLLTLPTESGDTKEMSKLLRKNLTGGLPGIDDSIRDGPEILDGVSRVLAHGAESSRPLGSYMQNYCVALLVRSLAAAVSEGGLQAAKRRLEGLDQLIVTAICEAVSIFVHQGGTKDSLVVAVIDATAGVARAGQEWGNIADAKFVDDCFHRWVTSKQVT